MFDVVGRAYEQTSLIVTTNLPFEQWTEVLGSERLTGAMLDRLTHRVHILETSQLTHEKLPFPSGKGKRGYCHLTSSDDCSIKHALGVTMLDRHPLHFVTGAYRLFPYRLFVVIDGLL